MSIKYIAITGSDLTGDGTIANPFRTPLPVGLGESGTVRIRNANNQYNWSVPANYTGSTMLLM